MKYPSHCWTRNEYISNIKAVLLELLAIYLKRLLIESNLSPVSFELVQPDNSPEREVYLLSVLETYARSGVIKTREYDQIRASIFKDWGTDIGRNIFADPF